MDKIEKIPVSRIKAEKHRVRLSNEDQEIADLAMSIRSIGLIYPLVVYKEDDLFNIISGHRRFAALLELQYLEAPCIVTESSEAQRSETVLAENLFRKDMSPVEVAAALKDCLDNETMGREQLARAMHRSVQWINRQMVILSWPPDIQKAIHLDQLSVSAAENIALIPDETYRNFLLRNAVENGATARTTAAWLQAYRAAEPATAAIEKEPVSQPERSTPAVPQAPCLACGQVYRTDQLSHCPLCQTCISAIRSAIQ